MCNMWRSFTIKRCVLVQRDLRTVVARNSWMGSSSIFKFCKRILGNFGYVLIENYTTRAGFHTVEPYKPFLNGVQLPNAVVAFYIRLFGILGSKVWSKSELEVWTPTLLTFFPQNLVLYVFWRVGSSKCSKRSIFDFKKPQMLYLIKIILV